MLRTVQLFKSSARPCLKSNDGDHVEKAFKHFQNYISRWQVMTLNTRLADKICRGYEMKLYRLSISQTCRFSLK